MSARGKKEQFIFRNRFFKVAAPRERAAKATFRAAGPKFSDLMKTYRGRLAPSPTGYLHLGHARTFWMAQERARAQGGVLVLRNEDLDPDRCKPEFVTAMLEDLRWFGFEWQEGLDVGGPYGPYSQSERIDFYRDALLRLREGGFV